MAVRDLDAPPDEVLVAAKTPGGRDLVGMEEPPVAVPPAPAPKKSAMESLIRGYLQGGTFGFSDELAGLTGGLERKYLAGKGVQLTPQAQEQARALGVASPAQPSFHDAYGRYRDAERAQNAAAQADNPLSYFGGNVLGTAATAPITNALMPLGSLKGLSTAQKAWALTKTGAPLGMLAGYGMSNADTAWGQAADTALGGAAAVAVPLGVQKGAEVAAPYLRSLAANRAVEALGTKLGQYRKLDYQDAIKSLGQELMEKGKIPFFGKATTIQQRVGSELGTQGQAIGDLLQSLDEKAASDLAARQKAMLPNAPATPQPGLIPVSELNGAHTQGAVVPGRRGIACGDTERAGGGSCQHGSLYRSRGSLRPSVRREKCGHGAGG